MNETQSTLLADRGSSVENTGSSPSGSATNPATRRADSIRGRTAASRRITAARRPIDRWLAGGLVVLGVALATNAVLGPLVTGIVTFPFSETLLNQTIGLEAVTLGLVVPWCLVAALLLLRGYRTGPVAVIPPAAYTVYMFAQYILGPEYVVYPRIVALHLGIFVLAGVLLALSWGRFRSIDLPAMLDTRRRRIAIAVFLLASFLASRYLGAFQGMLTGAPLTAEFASDPTMYWSIFLLDLGVVLPIAVGTAIGLWRGAAWAERATYAVVGWYVLVPISVAAMGIAMVLNNDPNGAIGQVFVLSGVSLVFVAVAAWIYRPLFHRGRQLATTR